MSFKEKFQKILQKLSLTDKAKANNLSSAEWDSLVVAYKEAYGTNLKDDLKEEKGAATISPEDAATALSLLDSITGEQNDGAAATATAYCSRATIVLCQFRQSDGSKREWPNGPFSARK